MYISKLRVRNYKSFLDSGEVTIDKSLFAFIGQNNTGKSALLDSIQCIFPSIKKGINPMDFHMSTTKDIEIELWFNSVNEEYLLTMPCGEKINKQIMKTEYEKEKLRDNYTEAQNKKVRNEEDKIIKLKKECIEKYNIINGLFYIKMIAKKGKTITKKYYLDSLCKREVTEADLKTILPQVKVIPAIRDPKNESTAGTNSYLRELIQMLDDEMQTNIKINDNQISYKELNRVLSEETRTRCEELGKKITINYGDAIGNSDYEVIIDSDVNIAKGTTYTTKIKDTITGVVSDILSCGTGYQSMIILSILETYVQISKLNKKYILLIEEPEVYLHPTLQRKMIDTLISIAETNQVIFTSHSPITVSKLSKEQIKLVKKSNGIATTEDIVPRVVIEELGIKSDDILINKGIIFVEGKDDKAIFEALLEKIEIGLSEKINVISAGNCNNLTFYANAEILINNKFTIPTLIVRDKDEMEMGQRNDSFINDILKNRGEKIDSETREKLQSSVRILDEYSLEYYFVDTKLLSVIVDDYIKIDNAIKCYECQYKYYSELFYDNKISKNIITSWYQPKYFLERFLDKHKFTEEDRENHNYKYEEQWNKFSNCESCNISNINNFFDRRKKINEETNNLNRCGKNYMIEILNRFNISELKETKLIGIITMLEEFKEKIN